MDPAVHTYNGSHLEHRTRQERGFHETENSLPDIKVESKDSSPEPESLSANLLSYLGPLNPLPKAITENDTVWLLDNTAFRSPTTNEWQAEFVTAVFGQHTGIEVCNVVAKLAEKVGLGKGDAAEATIEYRLMPFMQSLLPGREVAVDFAGSKELKLGPGSRNAISSDVRPIPLFNNGEVVPSTANVPQGANGILEMKTFYAEPEGWAVISDIDDTIKITQTSDPIGILKTTFVSPAMPITGMPELYASIQSLVPKAPFFYLSASPYNLYRFLREFREKHYPHGTLILRDANWKNLSGLLSNLTLGTQEYKVDRMVKINSWIPRRKLICIGDSTQSDSEAYGEIFRKFPGWVHLILIRKVTNIAAVGLEEKNAPERFAKAFEGVPSNIWHVFETPEICYKLASDAMGAAPQ